MQLAEIQQEFRERQSSFEAAYPELLATSSLSRTPPGFRDAILYAMKAGGKRVRPVLLLETATLCGIEPGKAMLMALGLELLHTYSLVHDDLPTMDNDDLRRGKPTTHKVYGEDIGILAGDALQTLAFEMFARAGVHSHTLLAFAESAGPCGMAGGQYLDIKGGATLRDIQERKTGRLIESSLALAYIEIDSPKKDKVASWGKLLGILFQIKDDILDASGTAEELGKTPGKDARDQKVTWVTQWGMERTRRKAESIVRRLSNAAVSIFSGSAFLQSLPSFIYYRRQ